MNCTSMTDDWNHAGNNLEYHVADTDIIQSTGMLEAVMH